MTAVDPTTDTESTTPRSRRDVLCGLVVALLAPGAVVAACSDSNSSGSGGTPAGSNGGSTGGGAGGSAGGTTLAALNDVPQGGGLVVNNPSGSGKILLVRPAAAEVKAYNAACTHQGTIVDPPQGGVITCPAHGSQYDASSGAVKRGPATAALRSMSVKVDGANVVLA